MTCASLADQAHRPRCPGTGTDAKPVRRAKVTLTGRSLTDPRTTDTDTSGSYWFERLPAGSSKIVIQKAGFVTLEADGATGARVILERGAAIEGTIGDADGTPTLSR